MQFLQNEILYLKADNDRMQNMMSQKGIQTPTSSPSPLQREGHRISLECPANLGVALDDMLLSCSTVWHAPVSCDKLYLLFY